MQAFEYLLVVVMVIFTIIGLFLFSKKKSWQMGFGWIGLFFLLLAINYMDALLLFNGWLLNHTSLAFWEDPFALLYGPFLYFFAYQLKNRSWNKKLLFHIVPFLVLEVFVGWYHYVTPLQEKHQVLTNILSSVPDFSIFYGLLPLFIHLSLYTWVAYRLQEKHRNLLENYYSTVDLRWARALLQMVVIIFTCSFFATLTHYLGYADFFSIVFVIVNIAALVLTLRLLMRALHQPLFQPVSLPHPLTKISKDKEKEIMSTLRLRLPDEKLFTDPEITLGKLSEVLDVPERTLSFVINQSEFENFYDLINHYRVNAARQILEKNEDPKLTVLEVMYDVGFNSKSSFNTQFKKRTGTTPSSYKK